jgi:hypothetical protein
LGFSDRLQSDLGKRYPKPIDPAKGPQPPGRFSFGTQLQGGPTHVDPYKAVRAPGLVGLIENYSGLVYAMVARNRDAVAKVPMRLLADGSRAQGKPNRACDPIRLDRSIGRQMAAKNLVSSAAVDQVYEIRNHPLLDLIDNPDPYGNFTRKKLIGIIVSLMDVVGSAYIVPEGNGWDWKNPGQIKGPPEFLWLIYSQYTIPLRLAESPIVNVFQYFNDRIPLQSMLWFRHNHSLKDVYGSSFSPTYASESYRKQEQELVAILSQELSIGPRPQLIVTAKDASMGVSPAQKKAFEQDLIRKHAAYGAGGVLVNDGSWEFETPDYPGADVAAKEVAQHDRDNMASIFGQPPTFYTVDTNLANLEAAKSQFAEFSVEPRCETVASVFTRLAKMSDQRLFFAHDPVMPEDDEVREKVFSMRLASGRATINQVNEEEKYPAVPWGDAPWLPGTLKQPDMIQEAHDQSLKQADQVVASGAQGDEIAADAHEHGKKVDEAKLKIEAKKAQKKPAMRGGRSIEEFEAEIDGMLSAVRSKVDECLSIP